MDKINEDKFFEWLSQEYAKYKESRTLEAEFEDILDMYIGKGPDVCAKELAKAVRKRLD